MLYSFSEVKLGRKSLQCRFYVYICKIITTNEAIRKINLSFFCHQFVYKIYINTSPRDECKWKQLHNSQSSTRQETDSNCSANKNPQKISFPFVHTNITRQSGRTYAYLRQKRQRAFSIQILSPPLLQYLRSGCCPSICNFVSNVNCHLPKMFTKNL